MKSDVTLNVTMEVPSEILDTVDTQDIVTGAIGFEEYYELPESMRPLIRSVGAFVINESGGLWVPRRASHKTIVPGGLDYSVGGHVQSGENYTDAVKREAYEELGWNLHDSTLERIDVFPPTSSMPYFRGLFLYHSNYTPDLNTNDFVEAYTLSARELHSWLQRGEKAKKTLHEAITHLLELGY
jgi:8-oxo-dGTP pyrophosphatase MutT (NUDIX family)